MGKLTHTVKGPIASFRSADKADIESLKLHFLPKQEGSGDPSPTNIRPITGWNGCNGRRSGKNLMPKDIVAGTEHSQGLTFVQNADGSIRITGTANNTVTKLAVIKNYANGSFPLKAGTYRPHMWSTDTTKNQIYISIMYNDGANSMYCNAGGSSYTYTLTEDVYVNQIRIGLTASEDVEFDLTIYPSLEKGSTPTSWEPCRGELIPITFPSNGKNIVDWVTPDGFSANVDFFNGWNANWISGPFRVDKSYVGKILTYSADIDNTAASRTAFLHVWTQDKNNNYVRIDIQSEVVDVGESKRVAVSMIVDDKWYDIYFGLSIGRGCAVSHPMVEWGDAATSYEPYTANNTFYGGYIDPVAGEIVAEYAFKVCDGSETWSTTATSGSNVRFHVTPGNLGLPKPINSSTSFAKFNYFKPSSTSASWTGFIGSTGNVLFYVPKTVAEDTSQWKEYLSEHNLQICYKLKEPIHIPVAPQDLKAFLDHNNFWSDMNDDTEVEYCFADRLSDRKLIMDTPHIESTSGSVASFNTDMKAPIVDLKAHFTPVQEGTGDPSPVNVRPIRGWTGCNIRKSGKNLLNTMETSFLPWLNTVSPGRIDTENVGTGNSNYTKFSQVFKKGTYTISGKYSGPGVRAIRLLCSCQIPDSYWNDYYGAYFVDYLQNNKLTFSPDEDFTIGIVFLIAEGHGSEAGSIYDLQLEKGSVATEYEEYVGQNIPISFPATKNLYDINSYPLTQGRILWADDGTIDSGYAQFASTLNYIPCENIAGKTITLNKRPGGWYGGVAFYTDATGGYSYISGVRNNNQTAGTPMTFTVPNNAKYMRFSVPANATDIQIELGSTATFYEPYGTVFGGYADLVRGKIVAEWKKRVLDGTELWENYGDSIEGYSFRLGGSAINDCMLGYQMSKCSMFKNVDGAWASGHKNEIGIYSDHTTVKHLYFRSPDGVVSTLNEFKQWLSENKPELCYKLATPIEYDLTPEQIKTLKGLNNIWSDANGNVDIKYWTH